MRDGSRDIITVTRVARDASWADIRVYQPHTQAAWTKRMRLPFPPKWTIRS